MTRNPKQQLVHFLSDMYSVEQQALAQMVTAPELAEDPALAADFTQHYAETEQQAELVLKRLEAHGESPSLIKGAIMKLGGKGFLLFARVMPETPGRLVTHAYSYEAMEWAGYEILARFAARAGDAETIDTAKTIAAEERTMMRRLENRFDAAEQVSHGNTPQEELKDHLVKHLAEVHAFESQGIRLLEKSQQIAGSPSLGGLYSRQEKQLSGHLRLVEQRLAALGSSPSSWRDGALHVGGLNWGLFFQAQSDTPAKLAAFVYAVLHLEIGGYELLKRTALRATDEETQRLCEELIAAKQSMAEELYGAFDEFVDATLAELQDVEP